MVGSEVFSSEVRKVEILMENFRRAIGEKILVLLPLSSPPILFFWKKKCWEWYHFFQKKTLTSLWFFFKLTPLQGLRIRENKEVFEGEVTELTPVETENPLGGYGKTVSHVVIGLKTTKGNKQLKLDPSIYESIQKEKVSLGDVIYIEANSGAVKVCHTSPLSVKHKRGDMREKEKGRKKEKGSREWESERECGRERAGKKGGDGGSKMLHLSFSLSLFRWK